MKDQARVVVVGGGVVGASVLYHLTSRGWTDVALVERRELTAGSTWHAAGGMHTLNGDPNVAALQKYSIELYREIEAISGQDCGIHLTGGIQLADTDERMDWLRNAHARGRYLGLDTELISVAEAKELVPYLDERHFVGALYDPLEGHVDPSGVTHAYAGAARLAGARIHRRTWARAIRRCADGDWEVDCGDAGTIRCEHVVNAGGLWAREVGRMCGLELPVLAMEHMYLLTEAVPGLREWNEATGREGMHAVDFGGEIYLRQEGDSLLLGTYERHGVPWSPEETPWSFGAQLLPPDLDRLADSLEVGFSHFPILGELGIKQTINGPFTFTPDGNPIIGPIPGQQGLWVAAGVMAGLSQGGGVGLTVANWIVDGDPGHDVWAMDVARYGDWATPRYTNAKVRENYGRRFRIAYPNEELPAGRPLRTTPIHDRLDQANAVWGAAYGLEVPLWFQRPGREPTEAVTLRRSEAFDVVAAEVEAVRTGVGLMESTSFAKYEVTGPAARAWLDHLLPNTMPAPGRLTLSPMLNEGGCLIGDFTVACVGAEAGGDEWFLVFGAGVAERYHMRWFSAHLPDDRSVAVRACGTDLCGLALAGPRSRDLLASVTGDDVSGEALRFRDFRPIHLGMYRCLVGRVSFTGELGYELWMPSGSQQGVFDTLRDAATDAGRGSNGDGPGLFGSRALDSMRLEKGFGTWVREYRPLTTPDEAGLGWTIRAGKSFVGREATLAVREGGSRRRLSFFTVAEDPTAGPGRGCDAIGDEPIWYDGAVVGWVTSGGYAHHSGVSMAAGYVDAGTPSEGEFEVEVFGVRRAATRLTEPLYDPAGHRMRA